MIVEQSLHDPLAIVEGALDRQRVHVRRTGRGHHPALHIGDAAIGKQYDEIDIVAPGESIDGGAAGIARRCDHDGGPLAALRQHVIHQARQQLHGHVLEGERRTVEQLENELVRTRLIERHHGRMTEGGVGLDRHAAEIGIGDLAADKRTQHLDRHFPVRPSEESRDLGLRQLRPDLGHIKTTVAGKPGQHHIAEAERGSFTAGRNITRQVALQRRRSVQAPDRFELFSFQTKPSGHITA